MDYSNLLFTRWVKRMVKFHAPQKKALKQKNKELMEKLFWTVGEDMICPATGKHCDDECCMVGSECNLKSPDKLHPLPSPPNK